MRWFIIALMLCGSIASTGPARSDAASCQRVMEFILGRAISASAAVEDRGELTANGSRCQIDGMVFRDRVISYEIASISWDNNGLPDFLDTGMLPETIDFSIEDFRVVPRSGDPWMDYMFAVQNRGNTTDVEVRASWDDGQRVFSIDRLHFDFPGKNSVEFSGSIAGLDPLVQNTLREGLSGVRIGDQKLQVENEGYLESLFLPPFVGAMSGTGADPADYVDNLKARAIDLIADLPESIFSPASRDSLRALVADAPAPRGRLEVALEADGGLSMAPFVEMGLTLSDPGFSEYWAHFEGARIEVVYQRSDPAE